jgi:hypothetical protein
VGVTINNNVEFLTVKQYGSNSTEDGFQSHPTVSSPAVLKDGVRARA